MCERQRREGVWEHCSSGGGGQLDLSAGELKSGSKTGVRLITFRWFGNELGSS